MLFACLCMLGTLENGCVQWLHIMSTPSMSAVVYKHFIILHSMEWLWCFQTSTIELEIVFRLLMRNFFEIWMVGEVSSLICEVFKTFVSGRRKIMYKYTRTDEKRCHSSMRRRCSLLHWRKRISGNLEILYAAYVCVCVCSPVPVQCKWYACVCVNENRFGHRGMR